MQAVLCDICERPIRGKAFEVHFIHGEAVNTESGSSRIVQRDGTTMTFLCDSCGRWTRAAMDYLRQGYHEPVVPAPSTTETQAPPVVAERDAV